MSGFFSCFNCGDNSNVIIPSKEIKLLKVGPQLQDTKSKTSITLYTVDTLAFNDITQKVLQLQQKQLPQRKAMQSEFIKQSLTKHSLKYLVERQWSQQYTMFLRTPHILNMRPIDNSKLLSNGQLLSNVREKQHYFIINQSVWQFVQQMYGGGPPISRDEYFPVYLMNVRKVDIPCVPISNPNTLCFLIAALQCLFSMGLLVAYLHKKMYLIDSRKQPIHTLLHKFTKTQPIAQELAAHFSKKFPPSTHHDIHQFLLQLISTMKEETKETKINLPSLAEEQNAQKTYSNYFKGNKSIMDMLLASLVQSTVVCTRCSLSSCTFTPTFDLALELEEDTLEQCIKYHFSVEQLDDDYQCAKCSRRTKATKKYSIAKTPQTLLLVLKKYNKEGKKIGGKIKYPLELDIRRVCKGHCGETRYILQSVVIHEGNKATGGHYYAFTRRNSTWYYADDSNVKETEVKEVLNRGAYLLFYERYSK